MIGYERHTLNNGMRVVLQRDTSTPLVALDILYNVGSKSEDPGRTGFAHLFEHLMFGGSEGAPSFDDPIQEAGGECNAFTNSDLTNFYSILPAQNLELAIFLEADRMTRLNLDERSLDVQRQVVTEEFKETCLNQPYGDVWHKLAPLSYNAHPYQWPTIGKEIDHISGATLDDVQKFYTRFYTPSNAVCVISGNFESSEALDLLNEHFNGHKIGAAPTAAPVIEPKQTSQRRLRHEADVPVDAIYMAFHMCGRLSPDYYASDLLSDLLGSGRSSRLYQVLVKQKQLCSEVDAYITGSIDPGLLIIEAKPSGDDTLGDIEQAVWTILEDLKINSIPERELHRHQNKIESSTLFSNCSILNKAMNLAYFDLLGQTELINTEHQEYQEVTTEDIKRVANSILSAENCSVLEYISTKK